ncbi:AAA domain (Cdc48 subfamily) protein [Leishmania donovani]|uniref:AAA domain (Cdc48 subfamily) protein n=1 Tax=Leishmania donovani TaxID=5661 RepID=A0A504X2T0_LEIDO|nr:AAA domain (Cdc48 subfamily) protein [Leishmania donovani]TPP45738.1 AAA domain (Cdc48 subfamily) protein [Leishmania donovani]
MGTFLSRQEELFLRRQWPELLEAAMAADTAALSADATSGRGDGGKPRSMGDAAPQQKRAGRVKKGDFRLSFQEWQAFLSVLELQSFKSSGAPSDLCASLSPAQLHVPAVALMVHLCVWWRGAISAGVLGERVEQLVRLVADVQHPGEHNTASTCLSSGARPSAGSHDVADVGQGSEDTPSSRRARLARFVKQRIVEHTFADMVGLTQQLLEQEGVLTTGTTGATETSSAQGMRTFELYDEKINNAEALKQRPILAVVMVLVLAVYASKIVARPELAARSVAHLEALEKMMVLGSSDGNRSGAATVALPRPTTSSPSTLAALWPLTGELEVALVHRQHEADAARCSSNEGEELRSTLQHMHEKRMSLQQDSSAAKDATPSERWAAGASQYIGQRPIWAALRSHFLSAGVFDADKPTVLVFFGPSGYGKSELAKRVASVLHGIPMPELEASGKMVYIHMPSFCTKDSIYSLVDPPAAHVGSGILLSALQKHPDAVVVLDEFEKSTAEAINNLWLSAFQKNGVLRSLKEASRSVSTVRATFILTCNIAAEGIAASERLYLNASPADQERIRALFQLQCKNVCQETMGDPFVNRVDHFFPLMPYTRAERRQFVCLLLERLLTSQAEKGRTIYATPGFVDVMVERLHTFHAATLEVAVRTQVVRMAHEGWTSGVLTVERRVAGGTVAVLLPATRSELMKHTTPASSCPASTTGGCTAARLSNDGSDDLADVGGRSLLVEAWESLPGGPQSLAQWAVAGGRDGRASRTADEDDTLSPPKVTLAPSTDRRDTSLSSAAPSTTMLPTPTPSCAAPPAVSAPALEKEYKYECFTDKVRILELQKELDTMRELLKQRDLEIDTLKDKILLLQRALALVLLSLLGCLFLMSLIIGLKLTLLFALVIAGCLVFVLGVPLSFLLDAVRGLFHLLGPYKAGGLLLLLSAWLARASRSAASCS